MTKKLKSEGLFLVPEKPQDIEKLINYSILFSKSELVSTRKSENLGI